MAPLLGFGDLVFGIGWHLLELTGILQLGLVFTRVFELSALGMNSLIMVPSWNSRALQPRVSSSFVLGQFV